MEESTQQPPEVTVVVAAYNCERFIGETLDCIAAQTFEDWECIVVDDASTDATPTIVAEYCARDCRFRSVRLSDNSGAAVARNCAIEMSSGRFIAFIDSDDVWLPQKLATQVSFMVEKGAALTYCDVIRMDETLSLKLGEARLPPNLSRSDMLLSNQITCSSAMYDTAAIGKVYMPLLRRRQDWGLWFTIASRGVVARNVGELLVLYRVRSNSVSSNKVTSMYYNFLFYRNVANLGFLTSIWRCLVFSVLTVQRHRRARRSTQT